MIHSMGAKPPMSGYAGGKPCGALTKIGPSMLEIINRPDQARALKSPPVASSRAPWMDQPRPQIS
jgi:hypothetical protein